MAKSKRRTMYKQVYTFTKDMGSSGDQILLGTVEKIDNVGRSGYVNNIRVSAVVNNYDGGDETPGIMLYGGTTSGWADDNVFVARATAVAGTVNLPISRWIKAGSSQAHADFGEIYLHGELTDITIQDNIELRFVIEVWGRFVVFDAND